MKRKIINLLYISIGSIREVSSTEFVIQDVEYYDYNEEDWFESDVNEKIVFGTNTLITKNGNFARNNEIKKNQEVIVIRETYGAEADVILITD